MLQARARHRGQTFWISTDEHRYVVRFAAGGVTADLAKVGRPSRARRDGQRRRLLAHAAGRLVVLRAGSELKKDQRTRIFLLDPRADARAASRVRPRQHSNESERGIDQGLDANRSSTKIKQCYTDFYGPRARVQRETVGGLAGNGRSSPTSRDDGKKMSMLGVAVIGEKNRRPTCV